MAKFNQAKNNFLNGEVSPKFYGRTDTEDYIRSSEELRNFIVYPQGGGFRRPGSQFITDDFAADTKLRIFPYVISENEKFLLIFSNDYVKSYRISDGTIETIDNSTGSGNGVTKYTDDQLANLRISQSGSLVIITNPDVQPQIIFKLATGATHTDGLTMSGWFDTGAATSTVVTTEQFKRVPYTDPNANNEIRLVPSGTTGTITVQAQNSGATPIDFFTTDQFGTPGFFFGKLQDGTVRFTSRVNANTANAVVIETLSATTSFVAWQISQWNGDDGWPRTSTFFEGRSIFGGNSQYPDTVWGSQIGDVFEMDQEGASTNADPFNFQISSETIDQIQWLSPGKTLNVGTLNREYIVSGANPSDTLGVSNVSFSPETQHGSTYVAAIRAENAPIFVTRNGQRLREFVFNDTENNFRSTDLSLVSEHVVNRQRDRLSSFSEPRIIELHHQENDNGVVWAIDNNGGLIGFTRNRQRGIVAFHNHILGGSYQGGAVKIESMAVVPNNENTHDDVYLVVLRTIDETDVRYIEKIGKEFSRNDLTNSSTNITDKPVYSDSSVLVRLGSPGKTFTGLDHLEGNEVDVLADGIYVGRRTVSSGSITVPNNATEIIAGETYRTLVKPLPVEAGTQLESAQGTVKRLDRVAVRFRRTVGAKVGKDESNLDNIIFRDTADNVEDPTPLFNGIKEIYLDDTYTFDSAPVIVQDLPLPFSINSVIFEGTTYD